jgi:hypothetical protein
MIVLYTILASSFVMAFVGWVVGSLTESDAWRSEPIDPGDDRMLGMLIGMAGGTVIDTVVARAALARFEQTHGRRATLGDAATVAGLIKTAN